jgi:hypothetical protein
MHRSGTSMVASWLSACGLDIGSDLLGAGLGNENGHYEDNEFLGLHERILNDNGIYCGATLRVEPIKMSKKRICEIENIINGRRESKKQWGWKEPRTCLFYKEYVHLIPEAFHLVVYRDYQLVVDSLVRRKLRKFNERNAKRTGLKVFYYRFGIYLWRKLLMQRLAENHLKAWIKYNSNLLELAGVAGADHCFLIDCADFILQGRKIFDALEQRGFSLTYVGAEQCAEPGMMASTSDHSYRFSKSSLSEANTVLEKLNNLALLRKGFG